MSAKKKPITPYQRLQDIAMAFVGSVWAARGKTNRTLASWDAAEVETVAESVRTADVLGFDVVLRLIDGNVVAVAVKRVEIPREILPDFLHWGVEV